MGGGVACSQRSPGPPASPTRTCAGSVREWRSISTSISTRNGTGTASTRSYPRERRSTVHRASMPVPRRMPWQNSSTAEIRMSPPSSRSESSTQTVPFSLYHGSSSHYLPEFQPGTRVGLWPYKATALNLLRETSVELKEHGAEFDFGIDSTLKQESGRLNWQHGGLYVTPSKRTAVKYAATGASFHRTSHPFLCASFCRRGGQVGVSAELDRSLRHSSDVVGSSQCARRA
jgi:hypothetical protein